MKNLNVLFYLLFLIKVGNAQTICETKNPNERPDGLKQQLIQLNKNWTHRNNLNLIQDYNASYSEIELIQLHLSMVEQELRKASSTKLSLKQKENRFKCLDILNGYWTSGLFPQNTYHSTRVPYFIDVHNTYCAVGFLLKKTGFDSVARKINKENNYGYLKDLAVQYKEIGLWAADYGFTLDELAWIQPTYNPTYTLPYDKFSNGTDTIIKEPCKSDGYIQVPHPSTWCAQFPVTATISSQQYFTNQDSLPSGDYVISVVDANNLGAYYQISLRDSLKVHYHQDFLTCTPNKLFSITIDSVSNGQSPFLYGLQAPFNTIPLQQSSVLDSLYWYSFANANPDLLIVQDANGCFVREPFFPNPDFGSMWAFPKVNASSCLSPCSGSIIIDSVWNASGPLTYYKYVSGSWVQNNSSIFDSLCVGTHYFKVEDTFGCSTIMQSAKVKSGSPQNYFQLNITQANVPQCNGQPVNLNITINGGVPPYTQQVQNYGVDYKEVTIVDSIGCRIDTLFHIMEPDVLRLKDSVIDPICGNTPGIIDISGIGGTPPYTSGIGTMPLYNGNNIFSITDANGCIASKQIYKVSKPTIITDSLVQAPVCNGDSAIFYLKVCGPSHPYSGVGFHTLPVGASVLMLTDNQGCVFYDSITVTPASNLSMGLNILSPITCYGDSALVEISGIGGAPPYLGSGQLLLSSGSHIAYIVDSNNCTVDTTFYLSSPTMLTSSIVAYPDNGTGNGSAMCTVLGGTPPYSYLWSTSATTDSVFGLISGWHYVTITDANACEIFDSVYISVQYPNELNSSTLEDISLYPNPANSEIVVSYNLDSEIDFRMYNSLGVLVFTEKVFIQNGKAKIPLINLANGIYYYEIMSKSKQNKSGKLTLIR